MNLIDLGLFKFRNLQTTTTAEAKRKQCDSGNSHISCYFFEILGLLFEFTLFVLFTEIFVINFN